MVNSDWAVGQYRYSRTEFNPWGMPQQVSYTNTRGFDGFDTLTRFGSIPVENYWVLVVAGGILFLALFRPLFGVRADLLAILLAAYGVVHILFFFGMIVDRAVSDPEISHLEYRAAPLVVGVTFSVLLISLIWTLLARVATHFQQMPPGERHFLKSFYQSLLGLPPR